MINLPISNWRSACRSRPVADCRDPRDPPMPAAADPQATRLLLLVQLLLLVVFASVLFLTRLDAPLLEPEEARYAEIPRQMRNAGSLLVPVLHGEPYYHKPPLMYWLVMLSYEVFGVHDWAARLVPGISGVLLVLLIYLWGRRPLGDAAAFLSSLILCLTVRFIYLGRMLTLDAVLTLCVVAALIAAYRALVGPKGRAWWIVSAVCCGLGLLTKGPVALVLVGVPILVLPWLDRRLPRPGWRAWLGYLGLAAGLAAPWYAAMFLDNPDAALTFFWLHNVTRFVAPFDHVKPFWFYLPTLALGLLPWSLLFFPLARSLWRKDVTTAFSRTPGVGFFLLAAVWCVFFFSCSGCKRAVYILPALPLFALALGCYLASAVPWTMLCWHRLAILRVPNHAAGRVAVVSVFVLFVAEIAAMYCLLPDYNRRFGLRGQVRSCLALCAENPLPVVCYPRRWDSVSYYLQHDDVRAYTETELASLISSLTKSPASLAFVKAGEPMAEFLAALPPSLEFVPCGRQGTKLHVGLVRSRQD